MEEVLFESERRSTREEVAEYLRSVADGLTSGEPITLRAGEEEVELDPPERPMFEVKAEREGPPDAPGERSLELELEWAEDHGDDVQLEIE